MPFNLKAITLETFTKVIINMHLNITHLKSKPEDNELNDTCSINLPMWKTKSYILLPFPPITVTRNRCWYTCAGWIWLSPIYYGDNRICVSVVCWFSNIEPGELPLMSGLQSSCQTEQDICQVTEENWLSQYDYRIFATIFPPLRTVKHCLPIVA